MKARVVAIIETRTGRFARLVILNGNKQPGTLRLFDIPGEDYQIGDKVWFTPAKIVRKMAIEHQAEPSFSSLSDERIREMLKNGHVKISTDPADASAVDICPGCSVCRPNEEEIPTGHDTIHPHPEGA